MTSSNAVTGELLFERGDRASRIADLAPPAGEIASDDQSVTVIGLADPQLIGE